MKPGSLYVIDTTRWLRDHFSQPSLPVYNPTQLWNYADYVRYDGQVLMYQHRISPDVNPNFMYDSLVFLTTKIEDGKAIEVFFQEDDFDLWCLKEIGSEPNDKTDSW